MGALRRKEVADTLRAKLKAKNGRLARQRELRVQETGREQVSKSSKQEAEDPVDQAPAPHPPAVESIVEDWEQEEDRLQNEANSSKRPPEDSSTARAASPNFHKGLDGALVSPENIQDRWDQKLLGRALTDALSPKQKKQREENTAAQVLEAQKVMCKEADGLWRGILECKPTTMTLEEILDEEDELLQAAFVDMEGWLVGRRTRFCGRLSCR
ncbi:hypothetical protein EJ03DRAFT_346762 [Teratosphaeria nubilosa]|uniref:Uncharacterized protein n=1 Tax=Teratosphaeria nubilosa TaxID=161662 RepID=A0A6G1LMN7_9PEZI|nr:hypothetical protein EJ03DRAFT_346762 [Teratosphaeria nubilosa]